MKNSKNNTLFVSTLQNKLLPFIGILTIILFVIFRPDAIMIGIYFLVIISLLLAKRMRDIYYLCISSIIALLWLLLTNNQYGYNQEFFSFFGLQSFPLFAWALGLFASYKIAMHILGKRNKKNTLYFSFFIYWILLFMVETTAYHIFNIKNISASQYLGLPICNCIHAPHWMQLSYFLLGPIYYLIILRTNKKNSSPKK